MAMEHPVRRRALPKGGARLARLRLGRPRHPRLLVPTHPRRLPPAPQVPFESDPEFEAPARQGGAPTPEAATGGGPSRLLLPDGRLHEDLDVDAHDVAAQA